MTLWRILYDLQTDQKHIWLPDSVEHLGTDDGGAAINYIMENLLGKPYADNGIVTLFRLRGLVALGSVRSFDPAALTEAGITVEKVINE